MLKKILKEGWPAGFEPAPADPQSAMLARLHYGHHDFEKQGLLKRFTRKNDPKENLK